MFSAALTRDRAGDIRSFAARVLLVYCACRSVCQTPGQKNRIACATLGLVISSLMGGPIARFLIARHHLEPKVIVQPDVGVTHDTKIQEIG
ncbi:MAG: sodium/glutamate symporter [Terrimicrobiaceae bacterium]